MSSTLETRKVDTIKAFNGGHISSFTMFDAFIEDFGMDEESACRLRDEIKFAHPDFRGEPMPFVADVLIRMAKAPEVNG